jgi:uncharacterized membrane protein YfcA
MDAERVVLVTLLCITAFWYLWHWITLTRTKGKPCRPRLIDLLIGFCSNFLDALGIGSFAPTAAAFKILRRVDDKDIPGTLNVGHSVPTLIEALIFITAVSVEWMTLVCMIAASVVGALVGARIACRLPRRAIQLGMGIALLLAACLFAAANVQWIPAGGSASGLSGSRLAFAMAVNCVLGVLNMLGIGLYAPCLILVSLLGMSPLAAFPIMMGSCAFLMPIGARRFITGGRYDTRASVGLTVGGVPGVLIAAFLVKSLSIGAVRWLAVCVVIYAGLIMLFAKARAPAQPG